MKKYIKKITYDIFIRISFHIIYTVCISALPYAIKNLIDSGFHKELSSTLKWVLIYAIFALLGMISQYITQKRAWKTDQKLFEYLRSDLFKTIISKNPYSFYSKEIGTYITTLNDEVSYCTEYFEYIIQCVEAAISLFTYAVFLFLLDYRIALIIYFSAAFSAIVPKLTGNKYSKKRKTLIDDTAAYTAKVIDLLNGYPLVNFETFKNISRRHKTVLNKMEASRYNFGKYNSFVNVTNGIVMYMIDTAVLATIAVLLFTNNITAGTATASISYIQSFMFPLRTIIDNISGIKSVNDIKRRIIKEISDFFPIIPDKINLIYAISCKNVCYKYDNFSINNFSYTFKKGKKYAIVGPSGCGKSTLLNLLTGLICPSLGEIKIDNLPVNYWLCKNSIVYLKQKNHIYVENYENNVTIFNSFANISHKYITQEKLEFLSQFSDCTLSSGGEQQLISFVRALNSGCDVLIMDEPFSALDPDTEMKICKALCNDKDKTLIMVTHNENKDFLKLFDDIVYLKNIEGTI